MPEVTLDEFMRETFDEKTREQISAELDMVRASVNPHLRQRRVELDRRKARRKAGVPKGPAQPLSGRRPARQERRARSLGLRLAKVAP